MNRIMSTGATAAYCDNKTTTTGGHYYITTDYSSNVTTPVSTTGAVPWMGGAMINYWNAAKESKLKVDRVRLVPGKELIEICVNYESRRMNKDALSSAYSITDAYNIYSISGRTVSKVFQMSYEEFALISDGLFY